MEASWRLAMVGVEICIGRDMLRPRHKCIQMLSTRSVSQVSASPTATWQSTISYMTSCCSMACIVLRGRGRVTKQQVANESANRHSQHHPAVISHEDEPARGIVFSGP